MHVSQYANDLHWEALSELIGGVFLEVGSHAHF